MKKVLFFAAVALLAASCSEDTFVGDVTTAPQDNSPSSESNAIVFASASKGVTRADIVGKEAAALLGNKFYVTGVKGDGLGTGQSDVFKTYSVKWGANTAGTTESNTSDWEYVGENHDFSTDYTPNISSQTVKYWDYNTTAYDFCAYSKGTGSATGTKIDYANANTGAYTLTGTLANLEKCYITDMKTVAKADYGKEVQLQFRSLASKVRMAIYETIPGYSVKEVHFYVDDATTAIAGNTTITNTDATLFGDDAFFTEGTYTVKFPHIGSSYAAGGSNATDYAPNAHPDYNKAHVTFVSSGGEADTQGFGTLNYVAGEGPSLSGSNIYLGRTSTTASFAGTTSPYYVTVLPNETGVVLEMRVNYVLENNDGGGETITIHGAKAYIPATYTKWLPNYAYTYIFKISDNTNGWTSTTNTDPAGLYPITFDAVVLDPILTDREQTTITTVATPSITTYQKGHLYTDDNEYSATKGNIYAQVYWEDASPELRADLNTNGALYTVTTDPLIGTPISEATVMDALNIIESGSKGRNGITLTAASGNVNYTNVKIPLEDGNTLAVADGVAAEITPISPGSGTNYHAYVYDTNTYSGAWYTSAPADIATANKYYTDPECTANVTGWDGTAKYLYQKDPTYIYSAKTVVAGDQTGWSTGGWYTDPDGVSAAGAWDSGNIGKVFYKKYTVNHKVYAVKVIKVIP